MKRLMWAAAATVDYFVVVGHKQNKKERITKEERIYNVKIVGGQERRRRWCWKYGCKNTEPCFSSGTMWANWNWMEEKEKEVQ